MRSTRGNDSGKGRRTGLSLGGAGGVSGVASCSALSGGEDIGAAAEALALEERDEVEQVFDPLGALREQLVLLGHARLQRTNRCVQLSGGAQGDSDSL